MNEKLNEDFKRIFLFSDDYPVVRLSTDVWDKILFAL